MRSSDSRVFCFVVDVVDNVGATLDEIWSLQHDDRNRGTAGVMLAASYHVARDILPRNKRRVHYSPAGVAFTPELSRYPAALQPHPQLPACQGRDVLAETVAAARQRGMRADAWVVYLHHDAADSTSPAGRVVNAFGDIYPVALCPASPLVANYAVALTADASARHPSGIFAEALHQQTLAHGFHHEREFSPMTGVARQLLALCFCKDCEAAGAAEGLDVTQLRSWVRSTVDRPEGWQRLSSRADLCAQSDGHLVDGTLARYLTLRTRHVSRLVEACAQTAASAGVEFSWFDASHALAGPDSADDAPAWQIGADLTAIANTCDIARAFYVSSVADLAEQLSAYTNLLDRPPAGAILRLLGGDLDHGRELPQAIRLLRDAGVTWIGYYHYGLAPQPVVPNIRAAYKIADDPHRGLSVSTSAEDEPRNVV